MIVRRHVLSALAVLLLLALAFAPAVEAQRCPAGQGNPVNCRPTQCRCRRCGCNFLGRRCKTCCDTCWDTCCSTCGPGTYGPGNDQCIACPDGWYQPAAGQTGCLQAPAGSAGQGPNLITCSPGTYTPRPGMPACLLADPGYYVPAAAATAQLPCAISQHQPASGQAACTPAPAGRYSNAAAISLAPACDVGTYQPQTGQTSCIPASPGYYVPVTGSPSQSPCEPGVYQPAPASGGCLDSFIGSYVPAYAHTGATLCDAGTFQPAQRQITCIDGPPGFYVPTTGLGAPSPCPPGNYSAITRATACLHCAVNTYALGRATSCTDCGMRECDATCDSHTGIRSLARGWCDIGATCVRNGTHNPAEYCTSCQSDVWPSPQNNVWSPITGIPCDDRSIRTYHDTCRAGACIGTLAQCLIEEQTASPARNCELFTGQGPYGCAQRPSYFGCVHVSPAGNRTCGCSIGSLCVPHGASNPENACQVCDVVAAPDMWTDKPAVPCDDGVACTYGDTCRRGMCIGTPYTCALEGPCATSSTCDGRGTCALTLLNSSTLCAPQMDACTPAAYCDGVHAACPPPAASLPTLTAGAVALVQGSTGVAVPSLQASNAIASLTGVVVLARGWRAACGEVLFSVGVYDDPSLLHGCSQTALLSRAPLVAAPPTEWSTTDNATLPMVTLTTPTQMRVAVRARNIRGAVVIACTAPFVYDPTLPVATTVSMVHPSDMLNLAAAPAVWAQDAQRLAVRWTPFSVASALTTWNGSLKYSYTVLMGPNATLLPVASAPFARPSMPTMTPPSPDAVWTTVETTSSSTSAVVINFTATPSRWYAVAMRGMNRAGSTALAVSEPVLIDTTAPENCFVGDGLRPLEDASRAYRPISYFSSAAAGLAVQYAPARDPESGIAAYALCIGTSRGTCNVVPWTAAASSATPTNMGSARVRLPRTPVSGQLFFTTLRVTSNAGGVSTCSSAGHVMDDTAPLLFRMVVRAFTQSLAWIDCELDVVEPESVIVSASLWLSSSINATSSRSPPSHAVTVQHTAPGGMHTARLGNLTLTSGDVVFLCGFVTNAVGLRSNTSCARTTADGAPLATFTVSDVHPVTLVPARAHAAGSIGVVWTPSSAGLSGLAHYTVQAFQCMYERVAEGIIPPHCFWVEASPIVSLSPNTTSYNFAPVLAAQQGAAYAVQVTAWNGAGAALSVQSAGVIVDRTPAAGAVSDGSDVGVHRNWFPDATTWMTSWSGVRDGESGLMAVQVAVGVCAGAEASIVPWTNVNATTTTTTATWSGLALVSATRYCTSVRVTNGAGLTTTLRSAGATMDATPPPSGTFRACVPNDATGACYTPCGVVDAAVLPLSWTGFEDPDSGSTYVLKVITNGTVVTELPLGGATSHTMSCVTMVAAGHTTFTLMLVAINGAGSITSAQSPSIIISNEVPTPGAVALIGFRDDVQAAVGDGALSIFASGFDRGAVPITSYTVTVSNNVSGHLAPVPALTGLTSWTPQVILPAGSLPSVGRFHVHVTATNAVGRLAEATSLPLMYDSAGVSCGSVQVARDAATRAPWWPRADVLALRMLGFVAPYSGIAAARVSVVTSGGMVGNWQTLDSAVVAELVSTGSMMINRIMPRGQPLQVTVQVTSSVGAFCSCTSTDTFVVDDAPPSPFTLLLAGARDGSDVVFGSAAAPWEGASRTLVRFNLSALPMFGEHDNQWRAPVTNLTVSCTPASAPYVPLQLQMAVSPVSDVLRHIWTANATINTDGLADGRFVCSVRVQAANGKVSVASSTTTLVLDRSPPIMQRVRVIGATSEVLTAWGLAAIVPTPLRSVSATWHRVADHESGVASCRMTLTQLPRSNTSLLVATPASMDAWSWVGQAALFVQNGTVLALDLTCINHAGASATETLYLVADAGIPVVLNASVAVVPACSDVPAAAVVNGTTVDVTPAWSIPSAISAAACISSSDAIRMNVTWEAPMTAAFPAAIALWAGTQPGTDDVWRKQDVNISLISRPVTCAWDAPRLGFEQLLRTNTSARRWWATLSAPCVTDGAYIWPTLEIAAASGEKVLSSLGPKRVKSTTPPPAWAHAVDAVPSATTQNGAPVYTLNTAADLNRNVRIAFARCTFNVSACLCSEADCEQGGTVRAEMQITDSDVATVSDGRAVAWQVVSLQGMQDLSSHAALTSRANDSEPIILRVHVRTVNAAGLTAATFMLLRILRARPSIVAVHVNPSLATHPLGGSLSLFVNATSAAGVHSSQMDPVVVSYFACVAEAASMACITTPFASPRPFLVLTLPALPQNVSSALCVWVADLAGTKSILQCAPLRMDASPPDISSASISLASETSVPITQFLSVERTVARETPLMVTLRGVQDGQSGILCCELALGSTAGGQQLLPWTYLSPAGASSAAVLPPFVVAPRVPACALDTAAKIAVAVALPHAADIFASLRVTNGAGLTAVASILRLTVDATPPDTSALRVIDGPVSDGAACGVAPQVAFHSAPYRTASCHWNAGAFDAESGITAFSVAIGTAENMTADVPWTTILASSSVWRALSVQLNTTMVIGTHFCSVKACNGAGMCSAPVRSAGSVVDRTPPVDALARVWMQAPSSAQPLTGYSTSATSLQVRWSGFFDNETSVVAYRVILWDARAGPMNSSAGVNVTGWPPVLPLYQATVAAVLSHTFAGMSLREGGVYAVAVAAANPVGMWSTFLPATSTIMVDTQAPTVSPDVHQMNELLRVTQSVRAAQGLPLLNATPRSTALQLLSVGARPDGRAVSHEGKATCVSPLTLEVLAQDGASWICAAGASRVNGPTSACAPCAAGWYKAAPGDDPCAACPTLNGVDAALEVCLPSGTACMSTATADALLPLAAARSTCTCGTTQRYAFQMAQNSSAAKCACAPGYARSGSSQDCVLCPAGLFKPSIGDASSECRSCPAGVTTGATVDATSCACSAGSAEVFDPTLNTCVCRRGLFRAANGRCDRCPMRGWMKPTAGDAVSLCQPCSWGTVPSADGASCVAATLRDAVFSVEQGVSGCAAGSVLQPAEPLGGLPTWTCAACPAGRFSPAFLPVASPSTSGLQSCRLCPPVSTGAASAITSRQASAVRQFTARWDGLFSDATSAILCIRVALGTAAGGQQLVRMTRCLQPADNSSTLAADAYPDLLQLAPGQLVWLTLQAEDAAGNAVTFASAAPVVWDTSPPQLASLLVLASPTTSNANVSCISTKLLLSSAQVCGGTLASATLTLRRRSAAEPQPLTAAVAIVDVDAASAARLSHAPILLSDTSLSLAVQVPTDVQSGIVHMAVCLGTAAYRCDVVSDVDMSDVLGMPAVVAGTARGSDAAQLLVITLDWHTSTIPRALDMFATLHVRNGAGMSVATSTAAFRVHPDAPTAGFVLDGPLRRVNAVSGGLTAAANVDVDCAPVGSPLSATWSTFSSPAGILRYEWAVGTSPGAVDVVTFTDVGLATAVDASAVVPPALAWPGPGLFFSTVRATANNGRSVVASSDGVLFVCPTSPLSPAAGRRTAAGGQNQTLLQLCAASAPVPAGTVCVSDAGTSFSSAADLQARVNVGAAAAVAAVLTS